MAKIGLSAPVTPFECQFLKNAIKKVEKTLGINHNLKELYCAFYGFLAFGLATLTSGN